ncbi:TPA: DUF3265 domain-containing protein [Vibrio parahaemolyticus]|nr:DUF3265 domain-containing protein [Vibrio parahaemolyticus]
MTRRSSGIHAAWHFWYAVGFSGESGLRKAGLGGIHPLTRRYALVEMEIIHHERFSEFITKYWPKSQNQKWKNCS